MATITVVDLEVLLELRERVLTPGHPARPVIWPYDNALATHFAQYVGDRLVGCVSITPQPMPGQPAARPYHLHSMAVEPGEQGRGLGLEMLRYVVDYVVAAHGELIWATARPTAVGFYEHCGFEVGGEMRIPPTHALMQYVWFWTSAAGAGIAPHSRMSE